jgi:hypothetical protein
MEDWAARDLGKILPPSRDSTMRLEEIIGAAGVQEIEGIGFIRFHATGDTGRQKDGNQQQEVAEDMALDYQPDAGGQNPAFFFNLGDVIYGTDKDNAYRDQFYRPNMKYPGKIIAIPGNHDGEVFRGSDPDPLRAFWENFCAPDAVVPPIAADARIFRETMTQPGIYWLLDAPFVQIVGLYSNVAEGPGFLDGAGGDDSQKQWLAKTLKVLRAQRDQGPRKALIIGVHHPPFSNGGHAGSPKMLADIDQACQDAGIMPDAVLSGHAHNYQRHTRRVNFQNRPMEIPFLVAGCGGHNDLSVGEAYGQVVGDHSFDKSLRGYGYLLVKVSPSRLQIDMWQVPSAGNEPFDTVAVDLQTNRLVGSHV